MLHATAAGEAPGQQPWNATERRMDLETLMMPFVNGAREMLGSMLGLACEVTSGSAPPVDVSGVLHVSGACSGQLTLGFPTEVARALVSTMLGLEAEEIDEPTIHDGVGEMANIVAGGAKAQIPGDPTQIRLSLPTIVSGPHHEVALFHGSQSRTVVVETAIGRFRLSVSMAPEAAAAT